MLQLLNEHVVAYDIKKDIVTDTKSLKEDKGLSPEQFIDVLALQGDTADNIPGVPDVGPKTATDWIKKYGSLDALYAHADEIKGKRGDNLRNFKDQAYLSKDLVIINTQAPVEFNEQTFAYCGPDTDKLADIYKELYRSKSPSPKQTPLTSPAACSLIRKKQKKLAKITPFTS
jgi:DNA polymerase-1